MKKVFIIGMALILVLVGLTVLAKNENNAQQHTQKQNQRQVKEKDQETSETPTSTPTVTKNPNKGGSETAQQHRSRVATAVQELVRASDRFEQENPGIGKQVRVIAQEQGQSTEKVVTDIEKIESRNSVVRFLVGPDYSKIKEAKAEIEQNKARIVELNQIMNQLQNEGDKTAIQEQIQILEQENTSLEEMLKTQEGGFSLFGWLAKMFQR